MGPATAVVSSLRAAAGRTLLSDRVINRYTLFRVAEEDVVVVAESMIDSNLETVRIVCRCTTLSEIIRHVTWKG